MLRNYCPGLAGLSPVCIQAGQLGPWEDGEGSNGMWMEGTASMLPLDPSPPAEMALKLTLAFAALACRDVEQKPWGLALLQPAARGQRAVCCHSPRCDIDACLGWRSRGSWAASPCPCLCVCLSVCHLRGAAGSAVSWHSEAVAGLCWGSPAMALCRHSLGADSAVVFLGFPGIALSCPVS